MPTGAGQPWTPTAHTWWIVVTTTPSSASLSTFPCTFPFSFPPSISLKARYSKKERRWTGPLAVPPLAKEGGVERGVATVPPLADVHGVEGWATAQGTRAVQHDCTVWGVSLLGELMSCCGDQDFCAAENKSDVCSLEADCKSELHPALRVRIEGDGN